MGKRKGPREVPDVGAFLSQVAHNLRAPVASARTMLSLLSEGYVGTIDARQAELVRRVEARMAGLQALTDDLIDLAAVRTGPPPGGGPARLDAVVGDVCGRFEAAAGAKGVELRFEKPSAPVLVSAAPALLEPLVTQLVGNAVAYTTRGSIRVGLDTRPRFVRLVVSDDGIGIPAGDRGRVFDEFFRAANAKALEEHGTGLGLAIVRAVACRIGATIELESAEGAGTTVTVRLPRGGTA